MHSQGRFDAVVTDHGYNVAKTATPQLWVTYQTSDGTITAFLAITDKTAERVVKSIRAMGYQGDDLEALADGQHLRGNQCCITIRHESYNGATIAKVAFVDSIGSAAGGAKRLSPAEVAASNVRRFNALLKTAAKSTPVKQPKAPASPEYDELNPPPIDEPGIDGMPF